MKQIAQHIKMKIEIFEKVTKMNNHKDLNNKENKK